MKFTKEELNFLDLFVLGVENKKDNRSSIYGKIRIVANKEKGEVTFTQFSSDINLHKVISKTVTEDFNTDIPTLQACNLIKLLPDNVEIEFTKDSIICGSNKYSFDKEDVVFPDIQNYVESYDKAEDRIVISDLHKLNQAKSYMGAYENNLDCIYAYNSYFVAKNDYTIASIKTENNKDVSYYFSKALIGMINNCKVNELEIKKFIIQDEEKEEHSFSACKIKDTYIFIVDKRYLIPEIFSEEIMFDEDKKPYTFKSLYDHQTKIVIDRCLFLDSLSRIRLFVNSNLDSRIFIQALDNEFLNITDSWKDEDNFVPAVVEKVSSVNDDELVKKVRAVSSIPVFQIASELEGKNVILYISENDKAVVVRVEDETENNFYIVRLLEI